MLMLLFNQSKSLSHFLAKKDDSWQYRELAGRLQWRLQKDASLFNLCYYLPLGVLQRHCCCLMPQTDWWCEHAQLRHQGSSLSRAADGLFTALLDSESLHLSATVTFTGNPGKCSFLNRRVYVYSKAVCTSFTVKKSKWRCVCLYKISVRSRMCACVYMWCQISFTVGIRREFCQVGACLLLDSPFHRNYPPRNILTLKLQIWGLLPLTYRLLLSLCIYD